MAKQLTLYSSKDLVDELIDQKREYKLKEIEFYIINEFISRMKIKETRK